MRPRVELISVWPTGRLRVLRRSGTFSLALALLLGVPSLGECSKQTWEGAATFGISLWSYQRLDPQSCWSVAVEAGYPDFEPGRLGLARIEVAGGAKVVSGDTLRAMNSGSLQSWPLNLRKSGSGPVEFRASLMVYGTDSLSYDELHQLLVLEVVGDTILVREQRTTLQISVRGGRRFRYGDRYLVALDPDEDPHTHQSQSPPKLLSGGEISCPDCGLQGPMELQVAATVGRSGSITWIRPGDLTSRPVSAKVWAAVEAGLRSYRFEPAIGDGEPTSGLAILRLRVVSE